MLIHPDDDGRYQVERGQQITVVTAAPLPTGYTRFYLQRQPLQVTVSPTSFEQLIQPVGTTYTFTVAANEAGSNLITFNLTAARPLPVHRPGTSRYSATSWSRPTSWSRSCATTRSTSPAPPPPPAATPSSRPPATRRARSATLAIPPGERRATHPPDGRERDIARRPSTTQCRSVRQLRLSHERLDCGFRFKVTNIAAAASARSFGIEYVNRYGGSGALVVRDPGAAKDVTSSGGSGTGSLLRMACSGCTDSTSRPGRNLSPLLGRALRDRCACRQLDCSQGFVRTWHVTLTSPPPISRDPARRTADRARSSTSILTGARNSRRLVESPVPAPCSINHGVDPGCRIGTRAR